MGWTPEKRAAAAVRMKARNADPEFRARMKALNADPEFKAAAAARMKALNADPEFKAAAAARMKALHADPEFRARMKALNADPEFRARMRVARGCVDVPPPLKKYAAKLRSCGIRGDDLRAAIDAEIKKQEGR